MALKMSAARGKYPGTFNFLSDQHVEGAGENQLRFQVGLDQARDFRAEHRPAVRLEGAKAVKAQDSRLMPRHGLLGVVGQIKSQRSDRRRTLGRVDGFFPVCLRTYSN